MRKIRRSWWLVIGALSLAWGLAGVAGGWAAEGAVSPSRVEPIKLKPEALTLEQGAPLSVRSLVTTPPDVRGVQSWTIESPRHRGTIGGAALSPDGTLLATGGIDGMVRIWNLAKGQVVRILVGHDSYSNGVAWSPCGSVLASAGTWDGTIRLWDPHTGQQLRKFKAPVTPALHVAWSPDGAQLLASGGSSGWTWLWNSKSEEIKRPKDYGQYLSRLVWSPDARWVILAGGNLATAVLDVATWKVQRTLGAGAEPTTGVAWSRSGRRIATASSTGVKLWDFEQEEPVQKIDVPAAAVVWSPDDKQIIVGYSGSVQGYDVETGKPTALKCVLPWSVNQLTWLDGPGQLFCMGTTNYALWSVSGEKPSLVIDVAVGGTSAPLWLPGRPTITGMQTANLALWDVNTLKRQARCEGHTAAVNAAAWSRDGKLLATASSDRTVKLWEAKTGELRHTLEGHKAAVSTVAFAPDGKWLTSGSYDKTIRHWDISGQSQGVLEAHTSPVRVVSWSPLGNLLASGDDDRLLLWDRNAKKPTRTVKAPRSVLSFAWNNVGKNLLLAYGLADEKIQLLNPMSGQTVASLTSGGSPPNVTSLVWLPGGTMLFSGRGNHTCQLWDVASAKVVHNLQAMSPVHYVTLAANGAVLVAGVTDRTVRFWEAGNGQLRGVLLAEAEGLTGISADGHWKLEGEKEPGLLYVALVGDKLVTLKSDEFASRFHWRNNPAKVKLAQR